ncbi:MAG: DUF371 domain-containing protein [Promethearchaeota archaeon]
MKVIERIYAWGHEKMMCTHRTTIEITKDKNMSKQGDCIIGVSASKACVDLSKKLKIQIKDEKKIKVILKVDEIQDSFYGYGNRRLQLLDRNDMVFRKSNFICERTALINCSKSSIEIDRDLIKSLRNSNKKLSIIFEVDE